MRMTRTRAAAAVAALALTFGLVACGSDSADTTAAPAETEAVAAETEAAVETEAAATEAVAAETEAMAADAPKDIVDTAVAAGSFNTLAKLLTWRMQAKHGLRAAAMALDLGILIVGEEMLPMAPDAWRGLLRDDNAPSRSRWIRAVRDFELRAAGIRIDS